MKHSSFIILPLFSLLLALIPIKAFALEAEAVLGEPFGVCRIEIPMSKTEQEITNQPPHNYAAYASFFEIVYQTSVYESNKRCLYPAWGFANDISGGYKKSLLFLFHGQDELNLILSGTGFDKLYEKIKIKPVKNAGRAKAILEEWWAAYLMKLRLIHTSDFYDPSVELGIASMMGRRLNLSLDNISSIVDKRYNEFDRVFGFLLGTESIRLAMQTNTMLQEKNKGEVADKKLPVQVSTPAMPVPPFDERKVEVEPLAMRVPQECFYLRFGSFSSFLETRDFLDRWGTIFRSILSSRSADYDMAKRIERQLALRESALSRYFGGAVVKDVAIIGTDTFLREGAAIGILFQARQNSLLKNQLDSIRKDILSENSSVQESSVTINGRSVSLLSSQGNSVRSFYIQDGDFHLITTSSWIVQAFLETAKSSGKSLGSLKEFRYARSQINSSEEGMFIYMSDPFFRNLVGPAYRVEMTRRMQSITELQMLALTRLAAMQEGISSPNVSSLIEKGFLPKGFGIRHDGSSPTLGQDSSAADSKRGALGSFLPIPDIKIDKVTSAEAEAYEEFAEAYDGIWTNMDPVFGLLNNSKKSSGERLELKLSISPYAKRRYGDLDSFLGKPTLDRIAAIPGDIISLEAQLSKEVFRYVYEDEENSVPFSSRAFCGLRDIDIPWSIQHGVVVIPDSWIGIAEYAKGYAGITIPPNLKDEYLNSIRSSTKPDSKGYAMMDYGFGFGKRNSPGNEFWSRRFDSYYIIGTGKSLLETVTPKVRIVKTDHPSQVSLNLMNLSKSSLGNFLRAEAYTRDRRTSAANAHLLQVYQQQLQPQDLNAALMAIQNQTLLCPLGGNFVADKEQPDRWKSTAWSEPSIYQINQVPSSYRQLIVDEIESMRIEFSIDPDTLKTRLEIQTKGKK